MSQRSDGRRLAHHADEITAMLDKGLTHKIIAAKLGFHEASIHFHLKRIGDLRGRRRLVEIKLVHKELKALEVLAVEAGFATIERFVLQLVRERLAK